MTYDEIKAVVRINVIDMFRFNLTCAYLRKKGIFVVAFSLVCFIMSIVSFAISDPTSGFLFLLGALIYTVLVPINLYYKAVLHVRRYKVNERDLFYTFSGQGLHIESEDNKVIIAWESIARIVETNNQIVVFINRVQGYIVPKRYFDTNIEPLQDFIKNEISEKKYNKFLISKNGIVIPKNDKKERITKAEFLAKINKNKEKVVKVTKDMKEKISGKNN